MMGLLVTALYFVLGVLALFAAVAVIGGILVALAMTPSIIIAVTALRCLRRRRAAP